MSGKLFFVQPVIHARETKLQILRATTPTEQGIVEERAGSTVEIRGTFDSTGPSQMVAFPKSIRGVSQDIRVSS